MVSLVMVVRDILVDRASQVALAEWNQSMQAFELDGPHEPFCMRVTVRSADGRLDNVDTRGAQERDHRAAPFSIAIANQHRARVQNTVDVVGEMPYGLQHEGFVWMRRGTNDVHAPGLKLDDKQGVVRDDPSNSHHLMGEEVRCTQSWPVRSEEHLPRRGSVWRWRKACVLQDLRDRRPRHPMTQIPKRSLHPCIAPPRVFRRHPENELANLASHARSARSWFPAGPLLRAPVAMHSRHAARAA